MEKIQLFCVKHRFLGTLIAALIYIIPFTVIFNVFNASLTTYIVAYLIIVTMSMLLVSSASTALTMSVVKKLNDECDPYPLLEMSEKIIAHTKSTSEGITARINRCVALLDMGEYEKYLAEMRDIAIESHLGILPQTKFVYYNNLSVAYIALDDAEKARIWLEKSAEFLPAVKNKKISASLKDTHLFTNAELLILEGKPEEASELLKAVENNSRARSVHLALASARANAALGNIERATEDLKYVIATGNKLYAVTEAKELLGKLA